MTEFMARVLTGCNATSYAISSALCFWMIDRFGRRDLMISGSSLQFFAYIMVAISVALLANAPTQVGHYIDIVSLAIWLILRAVGCSGNHVPLLLLCGIRMYLGNGTVGLSSRGQQPVHACQGSRSSNID